MKKFQGFTLIELMIVIAVIGVLASIAVPAYRNYIFKARTGELISFGASQKETVSEFIQTQGVPAVGPNTCTSIATTSPGPISTITQSYAVSDACVVTVQNIPAQFGGTNITITLTPTLNPDGSISWACTSGGSAYAPSSCP